MTNNHAPAVLHASPLINARRQYGGMRVVIDNRAVGEDDLRNTLALVSETNAGATNPLIVAFVDEHLPSSLGGWQPPPNTWPEFRGEWLTLPATHDLLIGGNYPLWCLNGAPGMALDPALRGTLKYTIAAGMPGAAAESRSMTHRANVRTGVHTRAQADALFASGNDWVAGWPLQAPAAKGKQRRADSRAIVLRLLQLAQAGAEVSELEAVIKQDAGLAFKMLRYINSAANGLSLQVQSFRHAVTFLGYQRLTRWLALLLLTSSDDPNQLPVMGISLRRGFFMKRIGKLMFDDIDPDEPFITGMFSLLNLIFAQPFEELLEQLQLPKNVSTSLRNHGQPYGPLLGLAEAIEGDDAAVIRDCTQRLGLKQVDVNRALLLAIRETDRVELS
jgi:EAL and modified HD-GYP domain-containing signal transduction protein